MQRRRGFTLIELMVVIAIISILASILFPVFSKAKDKARSTACLANLKQIGTAAIMYTQDWDQTFPLAWNTEYNGTWVNTWRHGVQPYIDNYDIYTCPGQPDFAYDLNSYNGPDFTGYAINNTYAGLGDNRSGPAGKHEAAIHRPSLTILFLDFNGWFEVTWQYQALEVWSYLPRRHMDGLNITFCDGHTKLLKPEQIQTDEIGSSYLSNWWTIEED